MPLVNRYTTREQLNRIETEARLTRQLEERREEREIKAAIEKRLEAHRAHQADIRDAMRHYDADEPDVTPEGELDFTKLIARSRLEREAREAARPAKKRRWRRG